MMYALNTTSERITPSATSRRATCPTCKSIVIAKTGTLKIHHWAHESKQDCDAWSEGETEWHRSWKEYVPKDQREVIIGPHRADIVNSRGVVIELQHSPISPEIIQEREQFYPSMIWLFDGTEFENRFLFGEPCDNNGFTEHEFDRINNQASRLIGPTSIARVWRPDRAYLPPHPIFFPMPSKFFRFQWVQHRKQFHSLTRPFFIHFPCRQIIFRTYLKGEYGFGWGEMFAVDTFIRNYLIPIQPESVSPC